MNRGNALTPCRGRGWAFAVLAAAVCLAALLVPLASELTDADGGHYYYTITNTTRSDGVIDVTVTDGGGDLDSIAGQADDTGPYTSTSTTNVGSWGFDPDTGLGPFNSFYAAFDPCYGNAVVGVLDPYDLTRLITGESIDGQLYNIMWVLPTVYWKAEDDGSLTLTDDPKYGGTAYAHTVCDEDGENVYGYIAYGVYEASVQEVNGTQVLTSASGASPTTGLTRPEFRDYANAQNVIIDPSAETTGHAMLWNFYQWELYKYCCVAAMGSWDSQGVAGNGNVYGGSFSTTGALDAAGPYAGTRGTGQDYYTASVKVFIENAWGSVEEFVDGVVITQKLNGLYVDQYCVPTDSTDEGGSVSLIPVSLTSGDTPLDGYGSDPSDMEQAWGFPTGASGTADSGLYDSILVRRYFDQCLTAGGYSGGELGCGLSYVDTSLEVNDEFYEGSQAQTGARLAFVFDAGEMTAALTLNSNGDLAGTLTQQFTIETGATFTIDELTRDGYAFMGWSRSETATEASYTESIKVWGDTKLYAVWQELTEGLHVFTLRYDANGGEGAPGWERDTGTEETHVFTVSSAEPTRSGYTFLGWSTDPSATTADYHSGESVQDPADQTVTLYAVWASSGDGSGDGGSGGSGEGGGSGDGGSGDGGSGDGSGGGTGSSEPVHSFTVYYDANGGDGAPATQRYTASSTSATLTLSSTEPTRSGYTFLGWSTDPSATTAEYPAGGSVSLTTDGSFSTSVTLYAVWAAGSASGSGSGSGTDGGSGSGSDGGSGESGGSSDGDSEWWVWAAVIVVIVILVAVAAWLGYRARGKS